MGLTIWQRIQLKLVGEAFLGWEKPVGYSAAVPMYAVKCKKHGLYKDFPHGHKEYFMCPDCLNDCNHPSFSTF